MITSEKKSLNLNSKTSDDSSEKKFKSPKRKFNTDEDTLKKKKKYEKPTDNKNEETPPQKTDWSKFKKEKKELKLKRKQTKDFYEVSIEAKKIYEKLKCRKTEKKDELVQQLYKMFEGPEAIKKVVMAHDTARIVQCMLKYASPKLREQISEDLQPIISEIATLKYAHYCVLRMLKYGSSETKFKLVNSFSGQIVKLASHNISSKILDQVYLTVANGNQKALMRQEFYGDMYKKCKDENVKCLSDTYKDSPHMKTAILGALKKNLEHVANKKLVDSSLVHSVLLEFLKECTEEQMIQEVITVYAALIPLLLTTKDGCSAAIICFWHSIPKGRRAIVKSIKEHLIKVCVHEHGHVFILAVVNAMDDTKATKKALFDPIYEQLQEIMSNQWGRNVIEWFVSPGDKDCFHPKLISFLDKGLKFSKKDVELRRKEIYEQIKEPISDAICEYPDFWVSDRLIGLATAAILNKMTGECFAKAADALAKIICKQDWTLQRTQDSSIEEKKEKTSTILGIEDAGMHMIFKKILKHDSERTKNNELTFGSFLIDNLSVETVKIWLTFNRGSYTLLHILENNSDDVNEKLKGILKDNLSLLKAQKHAGNKILLDKLKL